MTTDAATRVAQLTLDIKGKRKTIAQQVENSGLPFRTLADDLGAELVALEAQRGFYLLAQHEGWANALQSAASDVARSQDHVRRNAARRWIADNFEHVVTTIPGEYGLLNLLRAVLTNLT